MKIPGIKYRDVQSLGQRDLRAPMRLAAAETGKFKAIDAIGQSLVKSGEKMYETYVDSKLRTADTDFRLNINDYEQNVGTKEFFTPDEVPEDIEVPRTMEVDGEEVPRAQIPAWEVYPQMLEKRIAQSIEDHGGSIPEASVAQVWKQGVGVQYDGVLTKARQQAEANQAKEHRHQSRNATQEFLGKQMWSQAIVSAKAFPGSQAERDELVLDTTAKIRTGRQNNELEIYYNILTMPEDTIDSVQAIDQSIRILEDKDYEGDIHEEDKRYRMLELLRSKKEDINDAAKRRTTLAQKELLRDIRQATQANNKGLKVDPEHMYDLQDRAAALELLNADSKAYVANYDTMSAFMESWEVGRDVNDFLKSSQVIQNEQLVRRKGKAKTGEELLRYEQFSKASADHRKALAVDALSASRDIGLVKFDVIDFKDIAGSLSDRKVQSNIIQDNTGFFTGYLTRDEAAQLTTVLEQADPEGRAGLIGQINEGLGADAYKFYDQLDLKKSVPSFVMAGRRSAEGDQMSSNMILQGIDILEKNPNIIKGRNEIFAPQIEEMLGTAYWQDATSRAAVTDAVYNIYATLSQEAKEFDGALDLNRLESAFELATGGLADVNDVRVERPTGVSADDFEDWVLRTTPEYFVANGVPQNFSPKQTANGLIEGDIQLAGTFNRGEYNLVYARTGQFLFGDNQRPYVFKYDENAPLAEERGWWAEKMRNKAPEGEEYVNP